MIKDKKRFENSLQHLIKASSLILNGNVPEELINFMIIVPIFRTLRNIFDCANKEVPHKLMEWTDKFNEQLNSWDKGNER